MPQRLLSLGAQQTPGFERVRRWRELSAREPDQRSMHDRLRDAYMDLARESRRRQVLTLKV